MKRIVSLITLGLLMLTPARTEPQINRTIPLVTGTPTRFTTIRTLANSFIVQVQPGAANLVYVLYADEAATCSISTTSQIVATLGPGSATQPGQSFSFPSNGTATTQNGGENMARWCIGGSSGDTVIVSWDQR